ncbi:MAG: hypothetical protein ABJB11_09005 [Ferruginibacter sp.]
MNKIKNIHRVKSYLNVVLVILLIGLLSSCAASKEGRNMKKTINGNWTLETINVEGFTAKIKATVFNEADMDCFIGSDWNFIANNSMGSYTLPSTSTGCPHITRNIRWSIFEPKDAEREFQFKRLDDKKNPLDDNDGFRLSVASLTANSMQLKSAITYQSKAGFIVYNFVKK